MKYYFGKNISYKLYLMSDDGERVVPSSDAPSIWVYENRPSRSKVANEDGSSTDLVGAEITAWTEANKAYTFTIPAIDDPDITSAETKRSYYLGARFTLTTSEQEQVVIREFEVHRVLVIDEQLEVTPEDIERKFNGVMGDDGYKTEAEVRDFIEDATDDVRAELRNEGFKWAYITEPRRLKRAVIDKTLIEICNSEIALNNAGLEDFRDQLQESYESKIKSLVIAYDSDGDGSPDTEVQKASSARIIA